MGDLGLFGADYWNRHAEVEDALRADGPVHHATLPNGVDVWVVTRYEEARAVLTDQRLSKDAGRLTAVMKDKLAKAGRDTRLSGMFSPSVIYSDPDEHTRKRALLVRDFTAQRIAELRPGVELITARLLDDLSGNEVDLIAEFAFPLPVTVICELLGVPAQDRHPFRRWVCDLMEDQPEVNLPASDALGAYFTRLIGAKRAKPEPDLLSALVHAGADGDRLTDEELLGTALLLFVAGHETTTNMIGNAIHVLLAERSRWHAVAADPASVPAVVEEVLRYDSPVRMSSHRVTTEPVVVGDVEIPANQIVLVCLGAANRDPARYPFAHRFIPRRHGGGPHLGFGYGIHYCVGAALARMEGRIALTQLTQRFPGAHLVGARPSRQRSAMMNGFAELHVRLRQGTAHRAGHSQ